MTSLGDHFAGCTIYDLFTMTDASGRPAALAGSPSPFLVAYKDAFAESGFCTVTGLVLALNCNGRTGLNAWAANTNLDPAFFGCGHQYQIVLDGGCVDSLCVSGYVVGRFSLNKTSALRPTIHGRNAVDVTATGAVGVDWGNVENPSTAQALACTTTFAVTSVLNAVTPTACSAIFSVQSVLNAVTPTACSAIFSVQKVLDRPIVDACSTVYEVITISNSGVAKILDTTIVQPTGVFAWPASIRGILQWLGALSSNCVRQTATLQTLRARDDLSTLATAPLTCEATTVHRGSFT